MPNTPDERKLPAGLTKSDARRAKKLATGPLLGPLTGPSPSEAQGDDKATSAPLGHILNVKSRIKQALDPDSES